MLSPIDFEQQQKLRQEGVSEAGAFKIHDVTYHPATPSCNHEAIFK